MRNEDSPHTIKNIPYLLKRLRKSRLSHRFFGLISMIFVQIIHDLSVLSDFYSFYHFACKFFLWFWGLKSIVEEYWKLWLEPSSQLYLSYPLIKPGTPVYESLVTVRFFHQKRSWSLIETRLATLARWPQRWSLKSLDQAVVVNQVLQPTS